MTQSQMIFRDAIECPQCQVGRIHVRVKPYLQLYCGHLFTIPNAVRYECDACNLSKWHESVNDVVGDMLYSAVTSHPSDTQARPNTFADEDNPTQSKILPSS